jgi:DNA-binding CsgD family transcriptional regulator
MNRRERYIADVEKARAMKAAGISTSWIAYRLDKSVRTIRDYLKASALTTRLGVMDRDNEKKRKERKYSSDR